VKSKFQPLPLEGEDNLLTLADPSLWEKATVFMLYDFSRNDAVAQLIAAYGVTEGQANEAVTFAQSMITGINPA
jgi:hypothetical protein